MAKLTETLKTLSAILPIQNTDKKIPHHRIVQLATDCIKEPTKTHNPFDDKYSICDKEAKEFRFKRVAIEIDKLSKILPRANNKKDLTRQRVVERAIKCISDLTTGKTNRDNNNDDEHLDPRIMALIDSWEMHPLQVFPTDERLPDVTFEQDRLHGL